MVIDYERIDIWLSLHVYNIHLHSFCYNLEAILCEHFSQNKDLFLLFANELKKYTAFIIRYNTIWNNFPTIDANMAFKINSIAHYPFVSYPFLLLLHLRRRCHHPRCHHPRPRIGGLLVRTTCRLPIGLTNGLKKVSETKTYQTVLIWRFQYTFVLFPCHVRIWPKSQQGTYCLLRHHIMNTFLFKSLQTCI